MYVVAGVLIFVVCVVVIEMCHYAYRTVRIPDRKKVLKRLRTLSSGKSRSEESILRTRALSEFPLLHRILLRLPLAVRLDRLLQQATVQWPLGVFLLLMIFLSVVGFFGGSMVTRNHAFSITLALLFGVLPVLYLRLRKKRRMQKFQRQLPDALELIGRSLRAGHAFSVGMKLAAEEFDDPLGTEFELTLQQINFGIAVPEALENLTDRVDCHDLRYFAVSVILQRETGGNLAEIMETLAHIIRKRFRLQGHIRTLSAEARLSAIVLFALPFLLALVLRLINPEYLGILVTDPIGRRMAAAMFLLMILGAFVMKKMVSIDV